MNCREAETPADKKLIYIYIYIIYILLIYIYIQYSVRWIANISTIQYIPLLWFANISAIQDIPLDGYTICLIKILNLFNFQKYIYFSNKSKKIPHVHNIIRNISRPSGFFFTEKNKKIYKSITLISYAGLFICIYE